MEWMVKRTSVPAHIRTLLTNLPEPLTLDVHLHGEQVPVAALQLLKLAQASGPWTLGVFEPNALATVVTVRRGDKSFVLGLTQLKEELSAVVNALLGALFAPDELPRLLERLAFQSSTLATLQTLTQHMLQTTDVDRALHIMLSGVTSGYSLGFNRAALFVPQPDGRYHGSIAIGPWDEAEAHHVWEAMELGEKTIGDLVAEVDDHPRDSRLQRAVAQLSFALSATDEEEFAAARRSPGPLVFQAAPVHAALKALTATPPYVVAELRAHGRSLGFLFADNRYSRQAVHASRLEMLRFYVDHTSLVWENLRLLKQVEDLARLDGLTGVYNRRAFEEQLAHSLASHARSKRPCALLMVDLDHFKTVNDQGGHAAGDVALKNAAVALAHCLRTTDLLGRYGGDEFVVFLSDVESSAISAAVQRMGRSARAAGISLSMGVTHAGGPVDSVVLWANADDNLYRAKEAGRGCAFVDGTRVDF
jgi:diguanylate cyclase (GGDEF)-like protein